MELQKFEVGPFAENTYLLTRDGISLLIDPGFSNSSEFKQFQNSLKKQSGELVAVVLTHAHIDHLLGLPMVLEQFQCDVYLNHTDLYPWNHIQEQATMFGMKATGFNFTPKELPETDHFEIGPFQFQLLYTPGHAPDHISIYLENEELLIAGDTLFHGSVGRTDLYKGDSELLAESIRNKIYTLPDSTLVYPGHGPKTTVGEEKAHNPFVKG